jgi:hypothetical protein
VTADDGIYSNFLTALPSFGSPGYYSVQYVAQVGNVQSRTCRQSQEGEPNVPSEGVARNIMFPQFLGASQHTVDKIEHHKKKIGVNNKLSRTIPHEMFGM